MTVEFESNSLDRQARPPGEAAGKPGVVHDHPETSRSPGRPAQWRTARSPDEIEALTRFVGAVHSQIGRCEFAEDTGGYPQSASSFPGVDGGGIARYPG